MALSEVSPATLRRAHAVHPCMAVQNEYSLWSRQPELGMIQACAELGVTFVPFSPVARGMLAETSVDPKQMADTDWRKNSPRFIDPNYGFNLAQIDGFRAFCHAKGWKVSAAAIAWTLQKGDHVIPIPGTRTAAHLQEWLAADEIVFSDDDWAEIDRLLPAGFAMVTATGITRSSVWNATAEALRENVRH